MTDAMTKTTVASAGAAAAAPPSAVGPTPLASPAVDHLVVLAATLAEGVAWCQATLGVAPGPGGEHPLMGTHNRLLSVASAAFPGAYLEIIAIQPGAPRSIPAHHQRWFDMDSPALQQQVATQGPQLIHWVARVPDLAASTQQLAALGLGAGAATSASRATAQGLLQWHIGIRPDGQRLLAGAVPTLIQWGPHHPTHAMAAPTVQLRRLQVGHAQAPLVRQALGVLGLPHVQVDANSAAAGPTLQAVLDTPLGQVCLQSPHPDALS